MPSYFIANNCYLYPQISELMKQKPGYRFFLAAILLLLSFPLLSQNQSETAFKLIVLGSGGGIVEDNLNAYLLAAKNSNDFICLDAGTVFSGIEKAVDAGRFYDVFVPSDLNITKTGYIFTECIKAYLISHAHLDHIAGLVISSPADKSKPIYGSEKTINFLTKNIFNWEIWPNFTDAGDGFRLKKFTLQTVYPDKQTRVDNTSFNITPFIISHQEPYTSTAFLIEYYGEFVLYIGDTGSDELEKTNNLKTIWLSIAPIIRQQRLHAILMECSYPDSQPDHQLYGHLKSIWMMKELELLALEVSPENPEIALHGLTIVVTGIKPGVDENENTANQIHTELLQSNRAGVQFIIPKQGLRIEF